MSTNQNVYQDELQKILGGMSQEDLIKRIKVCQEVVDKLESDPIWKTVIADARVWTKRLDLKWQEVYDEKQLGQMRVMKMAYSHIEQLPVKYAEDLKAAQTALDNMRNTDSTIQRDYDQETKLEEVDAT